MDETIGIEKKYRERRVQLNRPVQYGGNSNITEKTVMLRPCVNTWKVLCEREEMTLANAALYVWLGGQRGQEHPGKPQNPTGSRMGKHQSDRIQVIGGKLLIGQLAPREKKPQIA